MKKQDENRNARRKAFLGMNVSTAANRLRKKIIFHLLVKHAENNCFACGEVIDSIDDLSIEHIKPWEGIDVELYWDLGNIAFSHLQCNRNHRYNGSGGSTRIIPPNGMGWCSSCRVFKSVDLFDKGKRWDGLREYCKACRKLGKGREQSYESNKENKPMTLS